MVSQLVKIEKIKFLGISWYKVELRFWLDLNSEVSCGTNSNWDFCLIWMWSWLKSPDRSAFRLPLNSAFRVSSSTERAVYYVALCFSHFVVVAISHCCKFLLGQYTPPFYIFKKNPVQPLWFAKWKCEMIWCLLVLQVCGGAIHSSLLQEAYHSSIQPFLHTNTISFHIFISHFHVTFSFHIFISHFHFTFSFLIFISHFHFTFSCRIFISHFHFTLSLQKIVQPLSFARKKWNENAKWKSDMNMRNGIVFVC